MSEEATIDDGVKAIIELTAERAATKAVEKHKSDCSIGRLWDAHERSRSALRKLQIGLIVVGTAAVLGGGIVGAVKVLAAMTT